MTTSDKGGQVPSGDLTKCNSERHWVLQTKPSHGGHAWCWYLDDVAVLEGWTAGSRQDARRDAYWDRDQWVARAARVAEPPCFDALNTEPMEACS